MKKIWPKERVLEVLKDLPKDIPINKKQLKKYYQEGILPFHYCLIGNRFNSIKNACKEAGLKCSALYGKEKMKHMAELNKRWNKTKIKKVVTKLFKQGKFNSLKEYINLAKGNKNIPSGDVIKNCFQVNSIHEAFKEMGIKNYKNHYWSNKRILNTLRKLYEKNGAFSKTQINTKFLKKKECCGAKLIRDRFGSLDKAAEYVGINFREPDLSWKLGHDSGRLGANETEILDELERQKGIKLERQFPVAGKFIDGYDIENNIAYEVDEPKHRCTRIQDLIRENIIKDKLSCEIIRIKDGW